MQIVRFIIARRIKDVEYTFHTGGLSHPTKSSASKWLAKNKAVAPKIWTAKDKIYRAVLTIDAGEQI